MLESHAGQAPAEKAPRARREGRPARVGPWLQTRTAAQLCCLLIGGFLLIRGGSTLIAGASFAAPGDGWRAAFQLAIAAFLLSSSGSRIGAYRAVIAVAVIYAVVTALGIVSGHDVLGVIPVDARDKIVHPLIAVLALAVGMFEARRLRR